MPLNANEQPWVLPIAELRTQVSILAQGAELDPVSGAPSQAWTLVRTAWAKVMTSASAERWLSNQFTAEVTHIVSVRWNGVPLAGGMQVQFGSGDAPRVFTVQAVDDVLERHLRINLLCVEVNGAV